MALSYNLGYQESISVHPTRRQNFAGKVYSNFPNIWEWVICSCAFVCGPCRARRWDIFKYRRCFVQSQFSKNDLEAKQSWIYAVLLLSVGPVGPGVGIYSIIDYVVCKVYFLMDQVDHVICWPSENLTNDILTKWEVEQLGTWPRTSWPHPWDIYP